MISFYEIYQRAVNLIKDPHLSRSYYTNTIQFQKEMYPLLKNGVSRITHPPQVAALLIEQQPPKGEMEVFEGNGGKNYTMSITLPEGAQIVFYVGGNVDKEASYVASLNQVEFSQEVPVGEKAGVEWYVDGWFTADFNKIRGPIPEASIVERVTDLLAHATVLSWAEKERNSLLDGVLNNLTDTDFKVHSPASALTSKKEWVKEMSRELKNAQQQLNWDLRNQKRSSYGY